MIQEGNCDEKKLWDKALFISSAGDGHRQLRQGWNAGADEAVLDEAGRIDPARLKPITFDPANRAYWSLGEKVGSAFADGCKLK